jgi:hypothetical protein
MIRGGRACIIVLNDALWCVTSGAQAADVDEEESR